MHNYANFALIHSYSGFYNYELCIINNALTKVQSYEKKLNLREKKHHYLLFMCLIVYRLV